MSFKHLSSAKPVVKKMLFIPAAMAGLASLSLAAAFQNGSFELGNVPPFGGETLSAGSTAISGWTVLPTNIDWINFVGNATASDGTWFLDLNGTQQGGIEQSFDTSIGAHYTITFDMKANTSDLTFNSKSLKVSAAGTSENFTYIPTATNSGGPWATETFAFTATSNETTLAFQSLVPNSDLGPLLDNVRVNAGTAAPEPTSLALILGGLFCLAAVSAARRLRVG